MSMSTHCVGFRPADEQWKRMKAIWDSCDEASVPIPKEVEKFFDGEDPMDKPGQEVSLGDAVTKWSADMENGFEVDLSKLPSGVQTIRMYNSY